MFQVEKRDGAIVNFELDKITDAIGKAFEATDKQYSEDMLQMLGTSGDGRLSEKNHREQNLCGRYSGFRRECVDSVRIFGRCQSVHLVSEASGKRCGI